MVGAQLKYFVYSRQGELLGAVGWHSAVERLDCRDRLVGLKENVIMGRLIPAGTGMNSYNAMVVKVEGAAAEEDVEKPELAAVAAPGGD